jgi:hypothetical protein
MQQVAEHLHLGLSAEGTKEKSAESRHASHNLTMLVEADASGSRVFGGLPHFFAGLRFAAF